MTTDEYNLCVDQYADSLYRFVLKNLRDAERAKDIVQDTFEKLWTRADTVDFSKAKSYLFTAAYHTMIDILRKDSRQEFTDEMPNEMDTHNTHYSDLNEILHEAMNRLPEVQKAVILLRDYEGYSYEEIARITGLSESQVKVYIFRGRVFLKNYIGSLENVI